MTYLDIYFRKTGTFTAYMYRCPSRKIPEENMKNIIAPLSCFIHTNQAEVIPPGDAIRRYKLR